jgi:hypothetical protein
VISGARPEFNVKKLVLWVGISPPSLPLLLSSSHMCLLLLRVLSSLNICSKHLLSLLTLRYLSLKREWQFNFTWAMNSSDSVESIPTMGFYGGKVMLPWFINEVCKRICVYEKYNDCEAVWTLKSDWWGSCPALPFICFGILIKLFNLSILQLLHLWNGHRFYYKHESMRYCPVSVPVYHTKTNVNKII